MEPLWRDRSIPNDKQILECRKIVESERRERQKIIQETGMPQGYVYGLIEKIADTLTTKEREARKQNLQ